MDLYGIKISQDINTNMLSITDLQEAFTKARIENGWKERVNPQDIISSKKNVDRILWILYNENYIDDLVLAKKEVEETSMIRFLKKIGVYKTYGRGNHKQVITDINIWVLLCSELHPIFYAKVMTFLFEKNNNFVLVKRNFEEEELQKLSIENHKKAQDYFGIKEGEDKVLHHINPEWRHFDKRRYVQWNPEDLQVMTSAEHIKLHRKLESEKIYKGLNACEIGNSLRNAIHKYIPDADYTVINKALNLKIFKRNEIGIRILASENELKSINRLEDNLTFCIERGFIKSTKEVLDTIESCE